MSDKPERGSWQEEAAYWQARCLMAEAGEVGNEKTLRFAEQLVRTAANLAVSTPFSFGTVFEHLLRAVQEDLKDERSTSRTELTARPSLEDQAGCGPGPPDAVPHGG